MKWSFSVLGAIALAWSFGPAEAGMVHGRLLITAEAVRAEHASPAVLARAERGVTDAVVYLERVPDKVERKLSGRHWFFMFSRPPFPRIIQSQMRFVPRVTTIAAGTAVQFENLDQVYHSAFSVSAAKRFDLGKYPPGTVDTVLFDRAGIVN